MYTPGRLYEIHNKISSLNKRKPPKILKLLSDFISPKDQLAADLKKYLKKIRQTCNFKSHFLA